MRFFSRVGLALVFFLNFFFVFGQNAQADNLEQRSLTISSSQAGLSATQILKFRYVNTNLVGSVKLEYCGNSPLFDIPCTAPVGLSASSATLTAQSGETGFTITSSVSNTVVLGRTASATSVGLASYTLANVLNPTNTNTTVFVRISTYASSNGSGTALDFGSAAFSTASRLTIGGFVPPYLTFCAGVTVGLSCDSANGNFISFGELSSSATRHVTSQFATATNDPGGYNVTISGTTMTSGNNTISAISPPAFSTPGSSQFGMNLRANTIPGTGKNREGSGTANAEPDFNHINQFTFKNSVNIARALTSTDFNRFTVSYITNIPSNQPPGIYSTTTSYIATVAF